MGPLSWVSHSTLIYTSELVLCSTICVHSATRHNIHMFFNILSSSPRCTNVFKAKSFVAFRRSNNLSNILVSVKLHKPSTTANAHRGSFRCGNNCLTCNYINDGLTNYTFSSAGETRFINHHIDCNSKNVIYLIQCNHCHKQYIGETKRTSQTC